MMHSWFDINERYLHGHLKSRSSYQTYCRIYQQYFAGWCEHPTKAKIRQWHREHEKTPAHANKGLGYLKAMYNWAINEELWNSDNPAAGIRRHAQQSRETTFTGSQLPDLMNALEFTFWKFRGVLIMLLTTGCRLSEALGAKWVDIDLDHGSWFKPNTKNGRSQTVPLPRQTCDALLQLPKKGEYLFMGAYGEHYSRAAAEKMWGILRRAEFKPDDHWPALNMPKVRLHDFRRTVATRLMKQGEPMPVVKAILNHHKGGDVTLIYTIADFDTQAAALQKHADGLWAMLKTAPADEQHPLPFTNTYASEARQLVAMS